MRATRLLLNSLRTYDRLDLPLTDGVTLFVGDNAQGKTNLLEAVYFCCVGRSHRTAHDHELIAHGCEKAQIELHTLTRSGAGCICVELPARARKRFMVDGQLTRRLADRFGHAACVFFSPEDLGLVKEGPAARRKYIDIALSQASPVYFGHLHRYSQTLARRNALLRAQPPDFGALDAYDAVLAECGAQVIFRRAAFCEELCTLAADIYRSLAPDETLTLRYAPNISAYTAEALLSGLARARTADLLRGTTTIGPHRDDLCLELNGRDAGAYGSQGQQRTVALAMKIAELHILYALLGEWPMLLLDDVLSELDARRRTALLTLLPEVQTLVTATDDTMQGVFSRRWNVSRGSLMAAGMQTDAISAKNTVNERKNE